MSAIEWTGIDSTNVHGTCATVGDRTAQVVRAYEGSWFAYLTLAGHICKQATDEPKYETYGEAKRRATAFLQGKVTPDVWPSGCCGK